MGATWSNPVRVNDDAGTNSQFLPFIALDQTTGYIAVSWYDCRNDTIWLDNNAAGWGWFVDPTPWEDSEFTRPGDQGEQGRMDLLTDLMHEVGHLQGHGHGEGGVMADTLAAGQRPLLAGEAYWADLAAALHAMEHSIDAPTRLNAGPFGRRSG